ncbi:hypothetical protein Egran_07048 [Elaphomyces granulatus]|uniref:Uncharacterized protein n=1 Tax=Elaphomyces granulatus TaxID=519963 RepID=A0A232LM10_9EURO|nr:hypothetical protein Egran_07048 [Elaphomyces granulatus]
MSSSKPEIRSITDILGSLNSITFVPASVDLAAIREIDCQDVCPELRGHPDPARCGSHTLFMISPANAQTPGRERSSENRPTRRLENVQPLLSFQGDNDFHEMDTEFFGQTAQNVQREEEFKKFEAEHSSGNKKAEEEANREAETKLQEINESGKKTGEKVVADLIHAVISVNPEVLEKIAVRV